MRQYNKYKTFVFDCDGVLLDSNGLKTQAFYQSALPYGEAAARSLVEHHVNNGGISRYSKFKYFLVNILTTDSDMSCLNSLLSSYASYVKEGLLTCAIAPGLQDLRQSFPHTRWLVASGSDQAELREVFIQRNIAHLFDGGIFGSPDTKDQILSRELGRDNIQIPAVFFGDSRYDYEAASRASLDFIFVSMWSEWKDSIGSNKYFTDQITSLEVLMK